MAQAGSPEEKPWLQWEISQSIFKNFTLFMDHCRTSGDSHSSILTQLCVLLVWSINRARESLPEFVVVFCESIKRARPCLASLNALSLVFIVKGVPKFAHVRGWRELRWRDVWGGEGGRRVSQKKLRSSLYLPCRHIDCQMQQCLLFELSFF